MKEMQSRSTAISMMIQLLKGEKVDEQLLDQERRSNHLLSTLLNNRESLFLTQGLLFRMRFPKKNEQHRFLLVLEQSDAEKRMITMHSKEHRGHLYLWALFNRDYYTLGAHKMAYDVVSRCPQCAVMKTRRRNQSEESNLSSKSMNTWAVDHKGPIAVGNNKKWILCGVELNLRLVHFSLANDVSARTTAKLLFDGIIAHYGSAVEIISDRGTAFNNSLANELFLLGSTHHRLTSTAHPQADPAENFAVRKLSSALKAFITGRDFKEWASNLRYLQVLLNSSLIHPYLGLTPYQLLLNSESTFYHPILEVPEAPVQFSAFWKKWIEKSRELLKILKGRYDVYLCQKGSPRHTVESLGLEVGQVVWVRIFAYSTRLAYLSSLLPRFKPAKILAILGRTSLLLEDVESGRKINRHLTDVYPMKSVGNYSNLFQDSLTAHQTEAVEDFGNAPISDIPAMIPDGAKVEEMEREAEAEPEVEPEGASWEGRLRPRGRRVTSRL